MAYILKTGESYTIPQNGDVSTAYCVIVNIKLNKHAEVGIVELCIYNSSADKDAGKAPFEVFNVDVRGPDFNTCFSTTNLDALGSNPYQKAYNAVDALMQAEVDDFDAGNTSSKNGIRGGFVWSNWESDEV